MDANSYSAAIGSALEKVKSQHNIVHQITNKVTMHDCANAVLALGASPIMAVHPEEVSEVTSISKALVLNIGTIEEEVAKAMLISAQTANDKGIPIVFDPVGVGVSKLRQQLTVKLLDSFKIAIIRCNVSELHSIYTGNKSFSGVDAILQPISGDNSIVEIAEAVAIAKRYNTIVAVTGEVDYVTDGKAVVSLHNGVDMLPRLTGTGCMTTALTGAYLTVVTPFDAAVAGITTMSVCGEIAVEEMAKSAATLDNASCLGVTGLGAFSVYLHNAIGNICSDELRKRGIIQHEVK